MSFKKPAVQKEEELKFVPITELETKIAFDGLEDIQTGDEEKIEEINILKKVKPHKPSKEYDNLLQQALVDC